MKKNFFSLVFMLTLSTAAFSQNADVLLHFETACDKPDSISTAMIQQWISNHQHSKTLPILLCGHTDSHADAAFNNSLSERRSLNIKRILNDAGFEQVKTRFYGESWPVCQGQDESCDYLNRRVEIVLGDTEEKKFRMKQDVEVPQVLFFNPLQPLKFTGNKGTEVNMAANSLCRDGKPVTGEVRCELHEHYSRKDIINANMNTMHNDKILETGGMIEIRMFQGNDELKLCGDAQVDLVFATQKKKPESDMQLFNGEIKNGQMNWQLQGPSFDNRAYTVTDAEIRVVSGYPVQWESLSRTDGYKIYEFVPKADSTILRLQREAAQNLKESNRMVVENKTIAHSFGLKSLGYANCDAIRDIGPLMEMNIEKVNDSNGTYLVVLENRNIYLNPWTYSGNNASIYFHAVPANEPISVIYLEKTDKGNRFARLHGTARQVESAKLDVKLLSDKELERAMAEL